MADPLGIFRVCYRLPWLAVHAFVGTPLTALAQTALFRDIPVGRRSLGEVLLTWWARMVCRIFGLDRRVRGEFERGPQLVAANHIAWIDIQLLHSVAAMGFVAKAEIADWPVIGSLARLGGTVFHRRGSHDSASGAVDSMVQRLGTGAPIAIFPEGGILIGEGIKRFHARMFGAAIETGSPVQPVMLRYSRRGVRYDDITFRPGEHFLANFFRLLAQKRCIAEVDLLPPLASTGKQRRQLAAEAEAAVRAAFDGDLPHD